MFVHKVLPFGEFKKYIFFDETTERGFEVVPEYGANLLKLVVEGQNIIDGYETPKDLVVNRRSKSNILLPFPNRLEKGKYIWQGEEYFFEINDAFTGNALHGFRKPLNFRPVKIETNEDSARIACQYEENGNDLSYPFPFTCEVDFRFFRPSSFELTMTIWNEGRRAIPVGMGWHPYFRIAKSLENVVLSLPECSFVGINEHMIPTGKRYPYTEFLQPKAIGVTVLDNCFALPAAPDGKFELRLQTGGATLEIWQETGEGKFNFLQLFTPPTRDCFAVEPMTCNVDAFNNSDGLIVLNPGEKAHAKFGLRYHKQ